MGFTSNARLCSGVGSKFLHLAPNLLGDGFSNAVFHTAGDVLGVLSGVESILVAVEENLLLGFHNIVFLLRSCYPAGFLSDSSGAYDFAHTPFGDTTGQFRSSPAYVFTLVITLGTLELIPEQVRLYRTVQDSRGGIIFCKAGSATMRYGPGQFLHCQLPRRQHQSVDYLGTQYGSFSNLAFFLLR